MAKPPPARRPRKKTHLAARVDLGDGIVGLDAEPWVRIDNGHALAKWGKNEEIRYNQRYRQAEKYIFFRRVFDFLTENEIVGDYHEFGCHRCRTFRMVLTEARRHGLDAMMFWAFDSFQGLPALVNETSVGKWSRGALTTSEKEFIALVRAHRIYADKVRTVPGFYAESLTAERRRGFEEQHGKIALATIDCDLYESAVPVFDFIDPLLQPGAVIYLDDLFVGNRGDPRYGIAHAFIEFRKRSRWRFVRHLDIGWWGRSYIVCAGGGDPMPEEF